MEQSSFIHENFGSWNEENGLLDVRVTKILSRRRRDLQRKRLRSTVILIKNESISQLDDLQ